MRWKNTSAGYGAPSVALHWATLLLMAMAYARHKVRVNAICPGGVETPMTAHFKAEASRWQQYIDSHPIGRVGTPEDIVHLVVYLASDESSWVTGSIFTIDGGRTAM